MSSKERLAVALERIADRLDAIDGKLDVLDGIPALVRDLQIVAISMREDLDTLRGRVLEQTARDGTELHRHQVAIQQHDGRLSKLEKAPARAPAT